MRIRLFLLALATSVALLVPVASANSYSLSCGGTSCGTVIINNVSGGVSVNVTMTGGYSIQAKANNGFLLNTSSSSLSLSLSGFSTIDFGAGTATLASGVNGGSGKFTFGLNKFATPKGTTSVTGLSFTLLGMSVSDLAPNNLGNVVSVHYCSPGAQTLNCPGPTGFANSTPSAVPEPGTLSLLGTGLIGLAGIVRRKFMS